jgi:DNA-binding SARP family transcriptional activator
VEIVGWKRPTEREAQLAEILCYLVFHRDRPVRPAALRLALRPDLGDEISEETLRAYLSHLRRAVGRDVLPHATKDGYRVSHAVSSDWDQFCRLSGGDADASQLEAALGLVRGRPFAGVPEGSFKWVDAELVVSAMETAIADAARRLAAMVAAADPERAEWAVRQGLLAAPYDWALWRLRLDLAARRGPVALARVRKEAEAVLGDDASSLVE